MTTSSGTSSKRTSVEVPQRPQVVGLQQPDPQVRVLLDEHPVAHGQQRRGPAVARKLESPQQEGGIEIRLAQRIMPLDVVGIGHLGRALIGRIADHQVVGPLPEHAHEAHPGGELLAAQTQAQVVAAGVVGEEGLQPVQDVALALPDRRGPRGDRVRAPLPRGRLRLGLRVSPSRLSCVGGLTLQRRLVLARWPPPPRRRP